MKRLFKLAHPKGDKFLRKHDADMSFSKKIEAKELRNVLNEDPNIQGVFCINRDVDHIHYQK